MTELTVESRELAGTTEGACRGQRSKTSIFSFRGGCSGGHGGSIEQHLGDGVGDGASGLLALGFRG